MNKSIPEITRVVYQAGYSPLGLLVRAVSPLASLGHAVCGLVGLTGARVSEEELAAARRKAREEGRNEAKAEFVVRLDALQRGAMQRAQHDDLNIALYTVAIACLARCAAASADNMHAIKDAVFGLAHRTLPTQVRAALAAVESAPPNLPTARARAVKLAPEHVELLDDMVAIAATLVDEERHHGLEAAWAQCRAA